MKKMRAAIVSYGNIGKYVLEALQAAPDFDVAGVVRRTVGDKPSELASYLVVDNIKKLDNVDVAIICSPSLEATRIASEILAAGINCVDSFDVHSDIIKHRNALATAAEPRKAVAIVAAGWDPGSDSIIRALLEAVAPKGLTYTNFGPGMSMGHTVCVKSKKGVSDALSMTIPTGQGIHRRMVYVKLDGSVKFEKVVAEIKSDPYFAKDETHVMAVENIDTLKDMGHGVNLVRKGVSGKTQNQLFEFNMRINNPALTAQILVSAARATFRRPSGAYTMIELPMIDLLPGNPDEWIAKLV